MRTQNLECRLYGFYKVKDIPKDPLLSTTSSVVFLKPSKPINSMVDLVWCSSEKCFQVNDSLSQFTSLKGQFEKRSTIILRLGGQFPGTDLLVFDYCDLESSVS